MFNLKTILGFLVGIFLGGGGVFAIQHQSATQSLAKTGLDHSAMGHSDAPVANSSNEAYKIAMDKMMSEMMVPYTGNADVDFAAGMIPHHQGAIDMAKVVIEFGKDPEIRKLAESVVAAQESEIAFMTSWLKANSK